MLIQRFHNHFLKHHLHAHAKVFISLTFEKDHLHAHSHAHVEVKVTLTFRYNHFAFIICYVFYNLLCLLCCALTLKWLLVKCSISDPVG